MYKRKDKNEGKLVARQKKNWKRKELLNANRRENLRNVDDGNVEEDK